MLKVAVMMGSDSDASKMAPAWETLKEFGIDFEVRVLSAHRSPDATVEFAKSARENGIGVIICAAGGAAHLAGVVAAVTSLPVIAVPISQPILDGLDSLLSMVQMPKGIPVATVTIDGARNAGLLATRIIGLTESSVMEAYDTFRQEMAAEVAIKDKNLAEKLSQGGKI
ncbi:MAG: 5-(carboxyamino)imidazole ribonucleotide mutase [Acidimicrobiales bacterium]|nr:5-(carboxyamino)imidazole ribonucleotide mutase [Acidimicrobiales bacterium]